MAIQAKTIKPKPKAYRSVQSDALKLDLKGRAKLAEKLLHSLDELSPNEIQELWIEEAMRRRDEMNSGKVAGIPAELVLKEAKARYR